jgi:hypothetical protein
MNENISNLKRALSSTSSCPDVEQLGQYADGTIDATSLRKVGSHVAACQHCKSELALLREFEEAAVRPEEERQVAWISAKLQDRSEEILASRSTQRAERLPWWKTLLTLPALSRAALALGAILIVVSGSIYLRRSSAPVLNTTLDSGRDVLRSNTVHLISPKGDLARKPSLLEWEAVPGAVRYQVRVIEVDRTELWKAETSAVGIQLPDEVRAKIQPLKSLRWQVTALDSSGKPIGSSSSESFRLSPQLQHKEP